MIRARLLIKGRVQGVGYRANTRRMANHLKLKGWVRNLPNGDVEAVVEGCEPEVDRLIQWCHRGPTSAYVREIKVEKTEANHEFPDFRVKK
ncbi:MAG: acylphosphatase [Candidatus Bathyarchaeota archaeon]|nr:acylphosphatase [Candidatus Bathyarchaeota archaeon]